MSVRRVSPAKLSDICTIVDQLLRAGNFKAVDELLKINPTRLTDEACVALLRFSFSVKHELKSWASFRDEVAKIVDPDIMVGLLDEK